MILSIEGQVVNAYIEPQFADIVGGPVVTVEFDAWENVPKLRRHLSGDLRVAKPSRYFSFAGYTQLLDLRFLSDNFKITPEDLLIDTNTSPTPAAFSWSGYEQDTEISEDEYEPGESYFGYSLRGDLESTKNNSDIHFDSFYAHPLFTLPKELQQLTESNQ